MTNAPSKDNVDILLGTYNGENFLQEQLDSLLKQTHLSWHCIIRDDGSSDRSREIIDSYLREYPLRFSLIQDNKGRLGASMNFGELLSISTADYIMFCDQDDVWLPEKIEISLLKLKEMETRFSKNMPLLVHTDLRVTDEKLQTLSNSFWRYHHIRPRQTTFIEMLFMNSMTGCSMIFNKSLKTAAKPIPKEAVVHDWWLAMIVTALGKLESIDQPMILYRQHRQNTIGAKNHLKAAFIRTLQLLKRHEIHKLFQERLYQAEAFSAKFETSLAPQNLKILREFLSLQKKSFMRRKQFLFNWNLLNLGWVRFIGWLLLI